MLWNRDQPNLTEHNLKPIQPSEDFYPDVRLNKPNFDLNDSILSDIKKKSMKEIDT